MFLQTEVYTTFYPSFPDILNLKEDSKVVGDFYLGVDQHKGVIKGSYYIKRVSNNIEIYLNPKKCWQPMPGSAWVSKYKYKAIITKDLDENFTLKSQWTIK